MSKFKVGDIIISKNTKLRRIIKDIDLNYDVYDCPSIRGILYHEFYRIDKIEKYYELDQDYILDRKLECLDEPINN